jgi:hypothetical protein
MVTASQMTRLIGWRPEWQLWHEYIGQLCSSTPPKIKAPEHLFPGFTGGNHQTLNLPGAIFTKQISKTLKYLESRLHSNR